MSMWRADSMPNFFSISWNMSEAESKVPFSSLASTETEMKSTKLATFIKSHQRFVCMCVCVCACMCASICVCLCVHLGLGVCLWVGVCLIYCASHGVCVCENVCFFSLSANPAVWTGMFLHGLKIFLKIVLIKITIHLVIDQWGVQVFGWRYKHMHWEVLKKPRKNRFDQVWAVTSGQTASTFRRGLHLQLQIWHHHLHGKHLQPPQHPQLQAENGQVSGTINPFTAVMSLENDH